MTRQLDFGRYEKFAVRAASDLRTPLIDSIDEAKSGWGLRRLSRSAFEKLAERARTDHDFGQRWLNRLQIGYDREKSQMAIKVEDIFADVPCRTDVNCDGHEDAA